MKSLVVYDSVYGNTEKIARTIADTLSAKAVRIDQISPDMLKDTELLIIGSPTRGFKATKLIIKFIKSLPRVNQHIQKIALFDTRIDVEKQNNGVLSFMVKRFGYGIDSMAKHVINIGFSKPDNHYFYVTGTEGPLLDHMIEDAQKWAKEISA